MGRMLLFGAIILFSISFSGCDKLHKLTQFNLEYDAYYHYNVDLPPNIPDSLDTPDIITNTNEQLAIKGSRSDLIESAHVNSVTLAIDDDDSRFSFLSSIAFYISAPGMPKMLVAYKNPVDEEVGKTITLDVKETDLTEYLRQDTIMLSVNTVTDQFLRKDIPIKAHLTFFVDAKILGI